MSFADSGPGYFIKDGWIWCHHEGSSHTSGGFTDYEPGWDTKLYEATPRNINHCLTMYKHIYNYKTNEYQEHVPSNYKDAFEKELFEGDEVYVVETNYSDRFDGYLKCKIIGFTDMFAKLKIIEKTKGVYVNVNKHILRMPHRLILV